MAITISWDWDDIGYPQGLEVEEISHVIEHPYGGGYAASRSAADKMQKLITLIYAMGMTRAQWLAFIEFWRSVKGSADAFYFEYPNDLYGSPLWDGGDGEEPPDGFDNDDDLGYGYGPTLTVKFAEPRIRQIYSKRFNRWSMNIPIIEVA